MKFRKAWKEMLKGKKVRRPFWKGYWAWENGTIMMHLREGGAMDIRDTDHVAYTFDNIAAKDWVVVDNVKEQQAPQTEVIGLDTTETIATTQEQPAEEPVKFTISIKPSDILAVTNGEDGKACISLAIGNNVEIQLAVEEKTDDVIDMLP